MKKLFLTILLITMSLSLWAQKYGDRLAYNGKTDYSITYHNKCALAAYSVGERYGFVHNTSELNVMTPPIFDEYRFTDKQIIYAKSDNRWCIVDASLNWDYSGRSSKRDEAIYPFKWYTTLDEAKRATPQFLERRNRELK